MLRRRAHHSAPPPVDRVARAPFAQRLAHMVTATPATPSGHRTTPLEACVAVTVIFSILLCVLSAIGLIGAYVLDIDLVDPHALLSHLISVWAGE